MKTKRFNYACDIYFSTKQHDFLHDQNKILKPVFDIEYN